MTYNFRINATYKIDIDSIDEWDKVLDDKGQITHFKSKTCEDKMEIQDFILQHVWLEGGEESAATIAFDTEVEYTIEELKVK